MLKQASGLQTEIKGLSVQVLDATIKPQLLPDSMTEAVEEAGLYML